MSEHAATITWKRETDGFGYEEYSRAHDWNFPGGVRVEASAAPDFLGDPERVDPEEALVAALSSCHMLTFLAIASKKRFIVDHYEDAAVGVLEKNENGKLAMTRVILKPQVRFSGERQPTADEIDKLHHQAHASCFIANSVTTQVEVEAP